MEQATITTEHGNRISVDTYESWDSSEDNIWLNVAVPMASISAVMTKAQAKQLAEALLALATS